MDALGTFRCLVRCAALSHTPAGNQRQWRATGDRPVADLHRGATAQCSADGAIQSRRLRFDRRMSALHCTGLQHCTGLHWVALGGLRHTSHLLEHDTCRACACSMTRVMKHSAWHVRCNVRPCGGRRTYSSNIISLTFTLSSSISLTTMALCLCASSVRLKASRRCYHPLHLQQELQRQTVLLNHISHSCIGMRLAFCASDATLQR